MGIRDVERNKKSSTDYADPVNINVSAKERNCDNGMLQKQGFSAIAE